MTWVKPDPFGAAMGTVAGFVTAAGQAKKDKAEADRQAELDRIAAVQSAATLAKTRADTSHIGFEESTSTTAAANAAIQTGYENRAKGFGLTPLTMPTPKPGKHFSTREQAAQYRTQGNEYTKRSETGPAGVAYAQADALDTRAADEEKQDLAVKTQAETALQHLAERGHWKQQELQAAKDELGRDLRAARENGVSLSNAATAALSRIQAASIGAAGALLRERETQHGEDKRQHYTEDNANRRFNVGLKHKDEKPPKPDGFRGIDPTTAMLMTKQLKEAISAGADRTKVFAEAARLHGISPVEVEGIYGDYAGTGS